MFVNSFLRTPQGDRISSRTGRENTVGSPRIAQLCTAQRNPANDLVDKTLDITVNKVMSSRFLSS
jgi:hypothetical protein